MISEVFRFLLEPIIAVTDFNCDIIQIGARRIFVLPRHTVDRCLL